MALADLIKHGADYSQVTYTVEAQFDESPVEGSFDSGEPDADRELVQSILARLERGDVWAWACVRVHATLDGVTETSDWLGGCSYDSEADYIRCNGYYRDQCQEALERLRCEVDGGIVTTSGEVFTRADTIQLATLILKRWGGDVEAATVAWRRLYQNSTTVAQFQNLVHGLR